MHKIVQKFLILLIPILGMGHLSCQGLSPGTTVVGTTTISALDIDASAATLSAIAEGQTTLTVTADLVTGYPSGTSQEDLSIIVMLDGKYQASFDQADFAAATQSVLSVVVEQAQASANLFSFTFPVAAGQKVLLLVSVGPSAKTSILRATLTAKQVSAFLPAASLELTDAEWLAAEAGLLMLQSHNLSAAELAYCGAVQSGSVNSTLAFGCFLTKLLLLPENSATTQLLADINYPAFDTERDVLDGIFASHPTGGFDRFVYQDYATLPLASEVATLNQGNALANLLNRLRSHSTTVLAALDKVKSELGDVAQLESLLMIALADTHFSFAIPKNLFFLNLDIVISYNDARLFTAAIKATYAAFNVTGAYDPGVNLEHILSADGTDIDYQIFVSDLNGAGETINEVTTDTTAFLAARDLSLIGDSKTHFIDALRFWKVGMQALIDGENSGFFDASFDSFDRQIAVDLANELLQSASSSGFVGLSSVGAASVKLNLLEFFNDPPDASDVTDADPFVYNTETGRVELVEAYFQSLLQNVAQF